MKKRCLSILVAAGCFCNLGYGQRPAYRDSLAQLIHTRPDDSSKVMHYYQYGEIYETSNPDSAVWYYAKAKSLAEKLSFKKGIAMFASYQIVVLNNRGKFREALELCKEAVAIYEEVGNKSELGTAYINLGSEWQYLSDFQSAAENYLKANKIGEELNNKKLLRITNNNLSSVFNVLQQFEKGKNYGEKSLQIATELKDDYAIASSIINIASSEQALKEYDKSLQLYKKVEQTGINTEDYLTLMDGWLGMADNYRGLKNPSSAEQYYKKVIDLSRQKNAPEYEMYAYMGISDLYLKQKQYPSAKEYINKGIPLAQELGSRFELKDLYLRASELNEATGNISVALAFRKKFELVNDSVINEKNTANINLLEAKYEFGKKEVLIKELEAEKKLQDLSLRQKNTFNYILLGSALTLLIISLLSFRNYKQKQKLQQQRINELETEKKLTAVEAVLKGEEQERTRLAKDLHDGLGGMLSGIKYSFQTMRGNLIMTPENQQAFERSMDMLDSSIKEMRRVAHNMMPEALVKFGLDTALKDFCNDINQSGALKINYQSLGLENSVVQQTTAITIYRIIQELINNMMKHAAAKHAIVQVSKTDDAISITVEDDGKGFDPATLKNARGIGWENIQSRVDYLKGMVDIQSAPGKGTSVHIEIKN